MPDYIVDQETPLPQLPAAFSGNNGPAETEIETEIYPLLSNTRSVLLVAVLSSAGLLTILNVQSITIMLPSLGDALRIPPERQQLVISIYSIASGSLMLLWGRLADTYGRRLVFLTGSTLFTLSSLFLPFSAHEIPFYILRVVQGLSGSAMMPSAIGIVASIFPPGKARTRAYVTATAVASLGSVLGSIFGGLVGSFLSWKWVFWIPAIIAAVTTVAAFLITAIPAIRVNAGKIPGDNESVDWIGAALISFSLVLLLISLTQGDSLGWGTRWVPPLIVVAILGLFAFVLFEYFLESRRNNHQPLLRVSMFRDPQFSALFILVGMFYAAYNSFLVFVTYFYQDYLGLSVLQTALRFLPSGITGIIVSFIVSPALHRIQGFYVLLFGLFCGLGSPLLFAIPAIPPDTTYWACGFPAMCLCLSVEVVWPVVGLLIAKKLPQQDQALGAGLLQTVSQISRSLGLAVSTAVRTAVQGAASKNNTQSRNPDYLRGLRAAQWMNVACVAVSTIIAVIFLRKLGRN
ncbi:hypothetical protein TCE0_034f12097 [Talaromyces pinophilus]|uniref:Major facilitator superfamily (MFS) profile domain-containing protein n=1 Tax=Talaromyces pinophilus TaxID=128442 RepID=A0A6V8HMM2_TALPI|nr:hypothetical protein TCE0_034f12097 [Talaromyces pinophilus]